MATGTSNVTRIPLCSDCGLHHASHLDALKCDWRIGGEQHVTAILITLGVSPAGREELIRQIRETET